MTSEVANTAERQGLLSRVLRNMAFHEFVALGFHTLMLIRCGGAPPGDNRTTAFRFGLVLWSVSVAAVLAVRGDLVKPGRVRAFFYRLAIFS